jgi:hypothetical protein
VQVASVLDPGVLDGPFDKAYSINSIHWWSDPVLGLRNIRDVLTESGRLAVTLDVGSKPTGKSCAQKARWLESRLTDAGFPVTSARCMHSASASVVCSGLRPSLTRRVNRVSGGARPSTRLPFGIRVGGCRFRAKLFAS